MADIQIREVHGVTIVTASGELPVGDAALLRRLEALVSQGRKNIILNMGNVVFLGDSVLAGLIAIWSRNREHGLQMKFAEPSPHVRNFLSVSRLERIFEIFDTEEDAISSFPAATAGS